MTIICQYQCRKIHHKEIQITEKNYSEEQAEKILNNKFNNKMFVMEQKGYKIIQKMLK